MGFWYTMEIMSFTVTERCARTSKEQQMSGAGDASERNNKRKCWNANESRASWEEIGSWEAEDDQFEGSIAGEDEEEALNLAETQLNEALASERNARRTVAQARAIMHDIKGSRGGNPRSANKKGSDAGEGKGTGQSRNRDSRGRAPGHRRMRRRVKLERGLMSLCLHQQDRASSVDLVITNLVSVPESRAQKLYGTCHELRLGSDEMNSTTDVAFGSGNRTRGRVLLGCDCDRHCQSVEAIGAILDKAQEAFGTEPYWVSVDVDPCASSVMPSENKRCPRSK